MRPIYYISIGEKYLWWIELDNLSLLHVVYHTLPLDIRKDMGKSITLILD